MPNHVEGSREKPLLGPPHAPVMLKLFRPLVIYDLESTGVQITTDRIVKISTIKLFPDGTRETKTRRLYPEQLIPPGASAVHGIYDAGVADEPRFRQIAKGLWGYLAGCDLCTFNGKRFDVPLLSVLARPPHRPPQITYEYAK